jgi:beta-carotene 15,15'-dioxygenase
MKNIEWVLKGLGIVFCLVFGLFAELSSIYQLVIVGLILFTVGVPHGAIDHLLSNPNPTQKSMIRFLIRYLGLIGIYLVAWVYLPVFALVSFLLMSAYHFGQSHFLGEKSTQLSWITYLFRGAFFLSVILFGDIEMTQYILEPLVKWNIHQSYGLGLMFFTGMMSLAIQKLEGIKIQKKDLLEIFLVAPVLYFSPLMIGFIVYFGFWHALPSMFLEFDFLKNSGKFNATYQFIIQLLPFSIISLVGIGLILFLGLKFLDQQKLILLFFILISLISFPHIIYMDRFLKKESQN